MPNNLIIHPMQSYEWEKAMKEIGMETLRVYDNSYKELSSSYLIIIKKLPFSDLKIGYLQRSSMPTIEGLKKIKEATSKMNFIFIKIEPEEFINTSNVYKKDFSGLVPSQKIMYEWTLFIDLKQSQNDLFKRLKLGTKRNISIAKRNNIEIKEMSNREGLDIFYKLYNETSKRKEFPGYNHQYMEKLFSVCRKEIAHIFIAYYKNYPLAAYEIFFYKNHLYYIYGGTSKNFRNMRASFLLMWEVILYGKKIGAEYFDMWGCLGPESYNEKHGWYGFTRFKLGFGGELKKYVGSMDLVINKEIYYKYNFSTIYLNNIENSGVLISDRSYNLI